VAASLGRVEGSTLRAASSLRMRWGLSVAVTGLMRILVIFGGLVGCARAVFGFNRIDCLG
jgi:hypothetical protein